MSKELEALKKVKYNSSKEVVEAFDVIEKGLQRLESIDNANPSEALNITKATEKYTGIDLSIVKQALLKAQEQEKALKIIKENQVSTFWINECKSVEEYNGVYGRKLIEEEIELLKRWLG